jgi:hypothetical protein
MRPRERRETSEQDLFRSRLDQIIDMKHELVKLARAIDWRFLEETFGAVYTDKPGQLPLPTRLMAGLAILMPISSSAPTGAYAKLKTYLGRVIRDIERPFVWNEELREAFVRPLFLARRVLEQERRQRGRKVHSLHAPEVECIGKGKAHP